MQDIRNAIKPAIQKSGMKQCAVANKSGMAEQKLTDVISKRRKLEANELIGICKAIGITPNEMMELAETEEKVS